MKKQIIICFENGKWLCDFITVQDNKPDKEILDDYVKKYDEIRNSNALIGRMLPVIINISFM